MKYARVEVKDKSEVYDAIAEGLKQDIKDIGIKNVDDVEFSQVYSFFGDFSREDITLIAEDILSDKVSQECNFLDTLQTGTDKDAYVAEIAYNPGVMDPVEQSALKAVIDAGIKGISSVTTSKKYSIRGNLSKEDFSYITERLLYNKIIQHVVLSHERKAPIASYHFKRIEIDILNADDRELENISKRGQLYLSLSEMKAVKEHFKKLKRNPTDCELEILAQTWSEHCKHKTMMGSVEYNGRYIENLLKDTVMKATKELDRPWCVSVFKDNAGIIKFDSEYNVCFKVETHNHPSALEPYGGAQTGIGGVIRDPMGTGMGAKPIMNTDVFCFGMPEATLESVPKGVLHPKRVLKGVVSGVRDYGNKMGIPTVNGAVCFDERYTANPLVFCGNVGIMPAKFSFKKVSPGDLIVAVGGRTGRDGIHGATFSSARLTTESEVVSGAAVQIGNPITEKKMLDTLLKARDLELYEAITDCGAGGFSSAVGEMAEETGACVRLENIPLKYKGLSPWEIWISEAQERMVLAVKPEKLEKLMEVFESENVEAVVIGEFTDTKKLLIHYDKNEVADLDMSFIHNGLPKITRKAFWREKPRDKSIVFKEKTDLTQDVFNILGRWNVCSKEWIIRQYDHEVQGGSVLKPLVGVHNDGPSDASITRPFLNGNKGVILANGINPFYGDIDPYWMSASVIDEALRQIVAVGGRIDKTALLDNFCWGNTEKPEQLGMLVRSAQACYDMAKVYGTPFISGKDSLNNEFNAGKSTISIPPTLLISAISIIDDVRKSVSSDIKKTGSLIYVIGTTFQEMGASQYLLSREDKSGVVPKVDPEKSLKLMNTLSFAIEKGLVLACHDSSEGGLAVSVSEMLFSGSLGAEISLKNVPREECIKRNDVILFSESNSRFIVEVAPENRDNFENIIKDVPFGLMGKVTEDEKLIIKGLNDKIVISADVNKLKEKWQEPFKTLSMSSLRGAKRRSDLSL